MVRRAAPTKGEAMSNTGNRAGLVALALASTLFTLIVIGVVGEVAVRYRERHRNTVPGTMPLMYYRHGRLGHALVRDTDYCGWTHVTAEGTRGPAVTRAKAPGTYRILVLGGSTVFDVMVSADSMAWPAQMQRWLQRLLPQTPVEVINAGVPGYRVIDQAISLLIGASRFDADLVILYDGHNDIFGNLRSSTGWGRPDAQRPYEVVTKTPWVRWFEKHSLLYCKLVDKLRAVNFGTAPKAARNSSPNGSTAGLDDRANVFESDVNAFLAIARSYGMKMVLATPTTVSPPRDTVPVDRPTSNDWRGAVGFTAPSVVLRAFMNYRQVFERIAKQQKLPLIHTEDFGVWGRRLYAPEDPIHFNDAGAACMGRQMAYALLETGLLPLRQPATAAVATPRPPAGQNGCQG